MRFIGVTGGVGAGKSEVLFYLRNSYRCRVMLADEIAHELMEPGTDCYQRLQLLFEGEEVFASDNGPFDRRKLAALIFRDEELLKQLNAIVHPAVHEYVKAEYEKEKVANRLDFLVLEAALLIEENYGEVCDELWYIDASEEVRRERLKQSRGYSDEKISGIFAAQLPREVYRKSCQVIIDNGGDFEKTREQVREVLSAYGIEPAEPL